METTSTEPPNALKTGEEEVSPPHQEIIQKHTDDSGHRTTLEVGSVDCIDSSPSNTKVTDTVQLINKEDSTSIHGLTPKFRVEGGGEGDSSVTITCDRINTDIVPTNLLPESAGNDPLLMKTAIPVSSTNGDNSIGHSSLSRQNSEEMPLSLVSWYSEPGPGDTNSLLRPCCGNGGNLSISITADTTIISTIGAKIDGSEEKENKTPSPNSIRQEDLTKSSTPVNRFQSLKHSKGVRMQDLSQRKGRLDKNSNLDEIERQRSRSVGTRGGKCNGSALTSVSHDKVECPRCSRKSKSGTGTPAAPSRTPKRQVVSNKKIILNLKKPIKSILKLDSRGSSGSEKQSSMDSLGSSTSTGVSPVIMTRSDSGPRAKFFQQENLTCQNKEYSMTGLKRVERYATLRIRKPRVNGDEQESTRRKLSYDDVNSGPASATPDLMTKSMSYLEKQNENVSLETTFSGPASGLKRQGSLRIRKPSPGWEPCTTRTTALRLLKLQESKGKSNNFMERQVNGDYVSNNHPCINFQQTRSAGSDNKSIPKVFSKLSSVLGQTASSSQKRLKQERGVQTDSFLIRKIGESGQSRSSLANCRSPTPISPIPISEDIPDSMTPTEEIKHLQLAVKRYKAKAIKYQHVYEAAELEKIDFENHIRELEAESKEMMNFLQDEKTFLAESLTEAETEIKKLKEQMEGVKKESESRCSSLVRLSEQHKQEALKSHALLKRLETDLSSNLGLKNLQIIEGAQGINEMKQRILTFSDTLLKKYKVSQELITSALAADGSNSGYVKLINESSLLLPLIKILSSAFEASTTKPTPAEPNNGSNTANNSTTNGTLQKSPSEITKEQNALHGSLEDLKQAIKEREDAEKALSNPVLEVSSFVSLSAEINELQHALQRFGAVIQSVVIQCDRKVSNITTNILEVLKSAESDKVVHSGGAALGTSTST